MMYEADRNDSKYSTNTPACENADPCNTKVGCCTTQQPCARISSALAGVVDTSTNSSPCSQGDCKRSSKSNLEVLLEKALADNASSPSSSSYLEQIVLELTKTISSLEESIRQANRRIRSLRSSKKVLPESGFNCLEPVASRPGKRVRSSKVLQPTLEIPAAAPNMPWGQYYAENYKAHQARAKFSLIPQPKINLSKQTPLLGVNKGGLNSVNRQLIDSNVNSGRVYMNFKLGKVVNVAPKRNVFLKPEQTKSSGNSLLFTTKNGTLVGKKQQTSHVFKHVNLGVNYSLIPLLLGLSRTSLLLSLPLPPSLVRRGFLLR